MDPNFTSSSYIEHHNEDSPLFFGGSTAVHPEIGDGVGGPSLAPKTEAPLHAGSPAPVPGNPSGPGMPNTEGGPQMAPMGSRIRPYQGAEATVEAPAPIQKDVMQFQGKVSPEIADQYAGGPGGGNLHTFKSDEASNYVLGAPKGAGAGHAMRYAPGDVPSGYDIYHQTKSGHARKQGEIPYYAEHIENDKGQSLDVRSELEDRPTQLKTPGYGEMMQSSGSPQDVAEYEGITGRQLAVGEEMRKAVGEQHKPSHFTPQPSGR